jgi:predicted dehydrogenase
MLDEMSDRIDAVLVGTPDHTHAVAAMAAMNHGKHVYCEKPLAHSVAEIRAMRQKAKDKNLITQVGNQGHSSDSIRVFCEWIWDGAIGKVSEVHAGCGIFRDTYCRINRLEAVAKERPPVPKELDWDLWQGPVAARPYHPDYCPWTWRGWMPYGSGALGDWVCHVIDPVFWALDLDMPTSIQAEADGYDPAKQADCFPPGAQVTFEFAAKGNRGPVKLVWYDGQRPIPRPAELEAGRNVGDVGAVVVGNLGKIIYGSHGAGGCRLIPEKKMQEYQQSKHPTQKIPRVRESHQMQWLNAVREGRQAGSPFEYGGRLSELGLLGVIAIRLCGQKLLYDEQAMRFTNSEEATRWLTPSFRAGWSLT